MPFVLNVADKLMYAKWIPSIEYSPIGNVQVNEMTRYQRPEGKMASLPHVTTLVNQSMLSSHYSGNLVITRSDITNILS